MPPIHDRTAIITQYAEAMGLPAGRRVVELLGQVYWWRGMAKDCEWVCRDHDVAQHERAWFVGPPFLFPTFKRTGPFLTWCIDCIILPDAWPDGARVIVIAVDAWSKWPEYRVLPHLTSEATAAFLYEQIIAWYGTPTVVRCD